MSRIVILADVGGDSPAIPNYMRAASRWDAHLVIAKQMPKALKPSAAPTHLYEKTAGFSEVLQIHNDVIISEDCPWPLDVLDRTTKFAMAMYDSRAVSNAQEILNVYNDWRVELRLPPQNNIEAAQSLGIASVMAYDRQWASRHIFPEARTLFDTIDEMGKPDAILSAVAGQYPTECSILPQEFGFEWNVGREIPEDWKILHCIGARKQDIAGVLRGDYPDR